MKLATLVLFSLLTFSSFAQDYPFAKDFASGTLLLKDGTTKTGQIKWAPQQNFKLRFRENEKGDIVKYSAADIAGFMAGDLKFVSLLNFEVYADDYALLGKTSTIKHTFAQLIDSGKFNIYLVVYTGYNAISGSIVDYQNFLFQTTANNAAVLVAYPYAIRMRDKKYENAKDNLYTLFKDYPDVIEKLKNYKQQDDFLEIIDMIKSINRR